MTETDSYVLSCIFEVTKDEESRPFWEYALRELGEPVVEAELGEVKMRVAENRVENPAKYLTHLLSKLLKEKKPSKTVQNQKQLQSYFSPTAMDFVKELRPLISSNEFSITDVERKMAQPYSAKNIPWATFVGPDFFTFSTNKNKSDEVCALFRTNEGDIKIPLLRGRKFPGDSERGILTTEHGKILGALENFWSQQGCKYMAGRGPKEEEICLCYCTIYASKLRNFLGVKAGGNNKIKQIKTLLTDLETFPYYLKLEDIPEFKQANIKGYGFTLLGSSTLLDVNNNPDKGTVIKVVFSETYSRQLLARRVITRSFDLVRTKGELAFLIHLFIEPILIKHRHFQKTILSLIHDLQLPYAAWHNRAGARKQQFEKAVRELSNKRTGTGHLIRAWVRKEKTTGNDYVLEACLTDDPANQQAQGLPGKDSLASEHDKKIFVEHHVAS